jgi:hypothetical protein
MCGWRAAVVGQHGGSGNGRRNAELKWSDTAHMYRFWVHEAPQLFIALQAAAGQPVCQLCEPVPRARKRARIKEFRSTTEDSPVVIATGFILVVAGRAVLLLLRASHLLIAR